MNYEHATLSKPVWNLPHSMYSLKLVDAFKCILAIDGFLQMLFILVHVFSICHYYMYIHVHVVMYMYYCQVYTCIANDLITCLSE